LKQIAILAALTLTACAAPGASGMGSFMTAFHPTEDFCTARGLTLDATTKQCVPPPKPPATAEVTGSVPPQDSKTRPQPQPQVAAKVQSPAIPAAPPSVVATAPPPVVAAAPPARPLLQEHQPTGAISIEPDAAVAQKLLDTDLMTELAHFVRASGYRCDSISALQVGSESHGYRMACNRSAYKYAISDKDGRWSVAVE
jgi:hypothetical protein